MDVELRRFKPSRGVNYILQVRYKEYPCGVGTWGPWRDLPQIREGKEEQDMQEYKDRWKI